MIDYRLYSDDELEGALVAVHAEQEARLLNRLLRDDNTQVVTLRCGFGSSTGGVTLYSRGLVHKDTDAGDGNTWGDDYYTFAESPRGRRKYLVSPADLFTSVKILPV